jgi:FkbM family methyltransferase
MSRTIARLAAGLARAVAAPLAPWRRAQALAHAGELLRPRWTVETSAGALTFDGPSGRALHDAYGFGKDEPETVAWVSSLPSDAVLWDIGANVGIYALFAARRGIRVLAFEPSAATLAVLTRNIELNGLSERVSAYPVAFAERTALDRLYMAATEAGHSMHGFGTRQTVQGDIAAGFAQAAIGYAIDDFVERFMPPLPTHVKLDVDSIEAAILRGGRETLRASVREVLVEIDGAAKAKGGGPIRAALTDAGFSEVEGFAPEAARNRLFRKI